MCLYIVHNQTVLYLNCDTNALNIVLFTKYMSCSWPDISVFTQEFWHIKQRVI